MGILSKNTIETWILPHLTVGSRGFAPTARVIEIVEVLVIKVVRLQIQLIFFLCLITNEFC